MLVVFLSIRAVVYYLCLSFGAICLMGVGDCGFGVDRGGSMWFVRTGGWEDSNPLGTGGVSQNLPDPRHREPS